jgi:hypothetical protein
VSFLLPDWPDHLLLFSFAFFPFKNLVPSFFILKFPVHLRKQMLPKPAASESSFQPDPVCMIIAQGQLGSGWSVSALPYVPSVGGRNSEWLSTDWCWGEGKLCFSNPFFVCLLSQRSAVGVLEGKIGTNVWVVADRRNHMQERAKIEDKLPVNSFFGHNWICVYIFTETSLV